MRSHLLTLWIFFSCNAIIAQHTLEIIDNDSTETNEERLELMVEFLSGIDFDNCADIGSGNLEFILKIADVFNDKSFVLEDIDSGLCNGAQLISQIEAHNLNNVDTAMLSIHIGNQGSTLLPSHTFDLVLMSGLIHELDPVDEFLVDVQRILKPGGFLVIADAFYELPPGLHHGCSNRFLTHSEIEQIIVDANLRVVKDWSRVGISTNSNGPYVSRIIQCSFD